MKIESHIPLSTKWAQRKNTSKKESRALANIDVLNFHKTETNQVLKVYKPEDAAWGRSQSMKLNSLSSILNNSDENWIMDRLASSSFAESKIHDYMREDKENDHVRSVEKSLNDWECTLDNLVTTDGDRMQSNEIDFGLIGKIFQLIL